MKNKRSLILLTFLVVFLLFLSPTASFSSQNHSEIIELTNKIREENNLPPLKTNFLLNKIAEIKAQDMLDKHYFAHISPQGKSPWDWLEEENYLYSLAGENLAADFNSLKEVMASWLSSPAHRANLLDPDYQEIGVAVVAGYLNNKKTTVIVQYFGTPLLNFGK